jgi:hypothetical protein
MEQSFRCLSDIDRVFPIFPEPNSPQSMTAVPAGETKEINENNIYFNFDNFINSEEHIENEAMNGSKSL